ncbi:MBL fold metallo-hydrolase [Aliifodinibius sp. S!AR15-10]|uniref:MBL fold metallo-hydrolase n=1 Tax=Aliifodinibius sp. S!AR15-10 TaxID=2950437 RepID=UPI00285BDB1D|nr:MBL fold metallo-hydrolase [Aliifodinibius sp. S!AR15-10]MDR8392744.1 MBL fold metallo-hydrolase [Aliifodinibius sp. S!AR15-10]
MNIGRFSIEQLSEGRFELFDDGRVNRLTHQEDTGPAIDLPTQVSSTVGIDPVLVSSNEHKILLDTGLGWGLDAGSNYSDVSNAVTNLDIFGLQPEDITHVILTHLHYDHVAGSTYTDDQSKTQPTFPNAKYYLQKREWEYALSETSEANLVKGASYKLDDLYRLFADDYLVLLEKDFKEIVRGITVLWTGGHTPGHQVIRINDSGESAYYLGDLLPSEKHLNRYAMRQMDIHPNQAKKKKIQLMRQLCDENACLLFYHSLYSKSGMLTKNEKEKYVLKSI